MKTEMTNEGPGVLTVGDVVAGLDRLLESGLISEYDVLLSDNEDSTHDMYIDVYVKPLVPANNIFVICELTSKETFE